MYSCNSLPSYQIGVLFYYLIYQQYPFTGESVHEKETLTLAMQPNIGVPPSVVECIRGMLNPDPNQRYSLKQIYQTLNQKIWTEDDYINMDEKIFNAYKEREVLRKDLGMNQIQKGGGQTTTTTTTTSTGSFQSEIKSVAGSSSTSFSQQHQHNRNKVSLHTI